MGHHHPMEDSNRSANQRLEELVSQRISRRAVIKGGSTLGAGMMLGGLGLAGCSEKSDAATSLKLGFAAVPKSTADVVSVPVGYTAKPLVSWGDPLFAGGTLPTNIYDLTPAQQEAALGDHHDGMYYFGLSAAGLPDRSNSARGLLAINHEAITEDFAHVKGPTFANLDSAGRLQSADPAATPPKLDSARTSSDECLKEMALHGITVVEVAKSVAGYRYVQGSSFNRRITPYTPVALSGPLKGSDLAKTRYDNAGLKARGTLNNCANGFTPWGTYLTCEENWAGYFGQYGTVTPEQARYGLARHGFQNLRWYTAPDPAGTGDAADLMSRFQLNATGSGATADYRNEANTFGYVVEIDPYDPSSIPKKRTALGRFSHEGCWPKAIQGKRMGFYMGDDSKGEYFYKFVTDAVFTGSEARQNDILDNGVLHVAIFNADGTGRWQPLLASDASLGMTAAEIAVHSRLAADKVGATKMDRPEWTAVHPGNGEVYLTLTKNDQRVLVPATGRQVVDPANPRAYKDHDGGFSKTGNNNGHVIRIRETSDDPAATTFRWDIYVFGAEADAPTNVNLSGLTDDNDFSSPDGLWFDPRGVLWLQTDDDAYLDETNCMMLAGIPGQLGDGGPVTVNNRIDGVSTPVVTVAGKKVSADNLRRFLVGPKGSEITGIDMTPDRKALFVNIQHPGELGGFADYRQTGAFVQQSTFNALETVDGQKRARSTTLVITKDDGGEIAL